MGKTKKSETAGTGGPAPGVGVGVGVGAGVEAGAGVGAAAAPRAPSAEGLAAVQAVRRRGPAPVHLWDPPDCGPIDIRIARDGTWFHEGTPIGRPGLVRLFASILRRDAEGFVLVTPVEKMGIRVDDAPFVAVDVTAGEGGLTFLTNLDEAVTAGPDRPIRVERDPATGEPAPYVLVRGGLEARIDRKTFYRLVDLAEEEGGWLVVRSGGLTFPLGPAE